jgi:hypothetical protein
MVYIIIECLHSEKQYVWLSEGARGPVFGQQGLCVPFFVGMPEPLVCPAVHAMYG